MSHIKNTQKRLGIAVLALSMGTILLAGCGTEEKAIVEKKPEGQVEKQLHEGKKHEMKHEEKGKTVHENHEKHEKQGHLEKKMEKQHDDAVGEKQHGDKTVREAMPQVKISEKDALRVAKEFPDEKDFRDKLSEAGYPHPMNQKVVAIAGNGVSETRANLSFYAIGKDYLAVYAKDGKIMTEPAQFAPVFVNEMEMNDLMKK